MNNKNENKIDTFNEEGLLKTEQKDKITIGIPQEVINDVIRVSAGKTMLFKSKLLFLVWLINRGDNIIGQKGFNNQYYQLHINAHRQVFGSDDLEKMKNILLTNNIIKQVGEASAEAKVCNTYQVVKRWKYKAPNCALFHFPIQYTFVKNSLIEGF